MAQNHVIESHAAAVMAVRAGRTDTPQWPRHEHRLRRAIVVSLVETWANIVPLKVSEDIANQEWFP